MATSHPALTYVKRVLFEENQIQERIVQLAKAIDEHFKDSKQELVLVAVLKGGNTH